LSSLLHGKNTRFVNNSSSTYSLLLDVPNKQMKQINKSVGSKFDIDGLNAKYLLLYSIGLRTLSPFNDLYFIQ